MEYASLPGQDQVEKVRQALDIVALGDSRLHEADRFLAAIRLSPSVWPVLHALIHSPPSQPYLTFAARTLHMRVHAEFLAFDERARADAFSLAIDGALRSAMLLQGSHSPIHYFSRAIGFAVAQASSRMRENMWQALNAKLMDPVLRCNVLAAVVEETDGKSTLDIARHIETKGFYATKAGEVVATAISLLQQPSVTSEAHALRLRAGVACLHTWCKYGNKHDIAGALIPVLSSVGLAGSVAESLTEIVGYTNTELDLLASVCDGLILAFRSTAAVSPNEVHHAIAEVCCALSEGSADDVVERKSEESQIVMQKATELLWLCLKSPDDKAFCAALNGWTSWVTAEKFAKRCKRKLLGNTQVALLVESVVQRMSSLQFVKDLVYPEESDIVESSNEKAIVIAFLVQASFCLGPSEYIRVVCPLLTKSPDQGLYSICAALTALSAAGECMTNIEASSEQGQVVQVMLDAVLSLLESCHSVPNDTGSSRGIRVCGLHLLSCYEAGLEESSDDLKLRAMRCAGRGIMDTAVQEEAAQLLLTLAMMGDSSIVSFLPDLLTSCKQVLPRMPIKAAEKCVKALGIWMYRLNENDRCKAMDELLSDLCHGIRWAVREKRVHEHEDDICRNLTLICGTIKASRFDENCKRLFLSMQEEVFTMARTHCTRAELSKCICRFLQVLAVPVLMEYGDEEDGEAQRATHTEERTHLAIQCAELCSETFLHCECGAEAEWLGVLREALDHVVSAADRGIQAAQACLSVSFTRATQGLSKLCEGGYDTRADVTIGYLRIANHLIGGCRNSLLPFVEGMTGVAMGCMKSTNASIVKEALLYFRQGFGYGETPNMGEAVVAAGGGAGCIAAGVLCGTRMRRCCSGVADVLYALVRVVSGGCETVVMRELLMEGFRRNVVPLQGFDVAVRERLLNGCCQAIESNRRSFTRALGEIARAYQRIVA